MRCSVGWPLSAAISNVEPQTSAPRLSERLSKTPLPLPRSANLRPGYLTSLFFNFEFCVVRSAVRGEGDGSSSNRSARRRAIAISNLSRIAEKRQPETGTRAKLTGGNDQDWYFGSVDDMLTDLVACELLDVL